MLLDGVHSPLTLTAQLTNVKTRGGMTMDASGTLSQSAHYAGAQHDADTSRDVTLFEQPARRQICQRRYRPLSPSVLSPKYGPLLSLSRGRRHLFPTVLPPAIEPPPGPRPVQMMCAGVGPARVLIR